MGKEGLRTRVPSYYEAFQCIGGACEDTCCAGWHLPVDEATYKRYKKVKDPQMKRKLDKEIVAKKGCIDPENAAKIKLKNNQCAFLTKQGWCDIYIQLGESYLSQSCKNYPRTTNEISGWLEYSLTASCPEAARVILQREEGIRFVEQKAQQMPLMMSAKIPQVKSYFYPLREWMIGTLQKRELPLEERLVLLEEGVQVIQQLMDKGQEKKVVEGIHKLKNTKVHEGSKYKEDTEQMLKLAQFVAGLFEEKKARMAVYLEQLEKMVNGLKLQDVGDQSKGKEAYEKGVAMYYKPFLETKGYMLENYLVNYIYERCMPLDGKNLKESFSRMMLYYHLVKIHLVGIANMQEGLTEKDVVACIQAFTKTYDHGEGYIEKIIKHV